MARKATTPEVPNRPKHSRQVIDKIETPVTKQIEDDRKSKSLEVKRQERESEKGDSLSQDDEGVKLQDTPKPSEKYRSNEITEPAPAATDKDHNSYYVYNEKDEFVRFYTTAEYGDEAEAKAKAHAEGINGKVR